MHVGIQNTINFDDVDLFEHFDLKELYLSGRTSLLENDSATYKLIGIKDDDSIINLTNNANYNISSTKNCTLTNNVITTHQFSENTVNTLIANVLYNNKKYSTSLAILFKCANAEVVIPVQEPQILKTFTVNLSKNTLDETNNVLNFIGKLDNVQTETTAEIFNNQNNKYLSNISNSVAGISGSISFSDISEDESPVIKFSCVDENDKTYECFKTVKLIGPEPPILKTFTVNLSKNTLNETNNILNFIGKLDNVQTETVAEILNNSNNKYSFNIKKSTASISGSISFSDISEDNSPVIKFSCVDENDRNYECYKVIELIGPEPETPFILSKLIINCENSINEGQSLSYSISGQYINPNEITYIRYYWYYYDNSELSKSDYYSLSYPSFRETEPVINEEETSNGTDPGIFAQNFKSISINKIPSEEALFLHLEYCSDPLFPAELIKEIDTANISEDIIIKVFNGHEYVNLPEKGLGSVYDNYPVNIILPNSISLLRELSSSEYEISGSQIKSLNKELKTIEFNFTTNKETLVFNASGIKDVKIIDLNILSLLIEFKSCTLDENNTALILTYDGTLGNNPIILNNLNSEFFECQPSNVTLSKNIITINDISSDKTFNVKFKYNNIEYIKQISTKIISQNAE